MYDIILEILYFLFHNLKKTRKPLSLTSQNNMITATELYHPSLTPLPPPPPPPPPSSLFTNFTKPTTVQ